MAPPSSPTSPPQETKLAWHRADHCGILVAFLGTYVRIITTTLRCFPGPRAVHLAVVVLLLTSILALKYGPGSRKEDKARRTSTLPSLPLSRSR